MLHLAVREAGWMKAPECKYLRIDEDGSLFCAASLMGVLRNTMTMDKFLEDWKNVGGFDDKYIKPCSPSNCPNYFAKRKYSLPDRK